jgi:hypothetical protein
MRAALDEHERLTNPERRTPVASEMPHVEYLGVVPPGMIQLRESQLAEIYDNLDGFALDNTPNIVNARCKLARLLWGGACLETSHITECPNTDFQRGLRGEAAP